MIFPRLTSHGFSHTSRVSASRLRLPLLRHVLNLRDDRLESRGEKQGQEGKCDECSPELPCRQQRPAVEGTVDIEEAIVSQGEEVAHTVEHGVHRHGWK